MDIELNSPEGYVRLLRVSLCNTILWMAVRFVLDIFRHQDRSKLFIFTWQTLWYPLPPEALNKQHLQRALAHKTLAERLNVLSLLMEG